MKFVIIGNRRTGSTMLATFMCSHPSGIWCFQEVSYDFVPKLVDGQGCVLRYIELEKQIPDFTGFRLIHILRKNIVAHTVSDMITCYGWRGAHAYGEYKEHTPKVKMTVDLDEFNKWGKKNVELTLKYFEKFKGIALPIFYEDITNDESIKTLPQDISDKLCDFLEITRAVLTTKMCKVNSMNYQNYITNYQEIENFDVDWVKEYKEVINA